MPQVSDKFGPVYANVTLDGSGNGQVSFQAQGANVRITNLFVRVSTQTNQAVCRMYKNQVSDSSNISSTNSGSTGAAAHGAIDLFDGENVIVRWTGGDAGAIATATFVGVKLPFNERPTSEELTWDDPIAAGDGSLIYPAIKSPNYVAGVSGWRIAKDGTVEFGNATIRGTFTATGANNAYARLTTTGGTGFGTAVLYLRPPDLPNINTTEIDAGAITAFSNQPGGAGVVPSAYLNLEIDSPAWSFGSTATDKRTPALILNTASHDGTVHPYAKVTTSGPTTPTTFDIILDGKATVNGYVDGNPSCLLTVAPAISMASAAALSTLTPNNIDDRFGMFDNVSTVTVPATGIWEIGILGTWAAQNPAAGWRGVQTAVNGATSRRFKLPTNATVDAQIIGANLIYRIQLFANDQITFLAGQNSGAAILFTADMWVELIRPL